MEMEETQTGMSLKYKLLILLTLVPVFSLGVYLYVAIEEFKKDKIAYVHDSSAAVASSLAMQVRSQSDNFIERVTPIIENYDRVERTFLQTAIDLFKKADRLDAIIIFQKTENGKYIEVNHLKKNSDYANGFYTLHRKWGELQSKALTDTVSIIAMKDFNSHLAMGLLVGNLEDSKHVIVAGLFRAKSLRASFEDSKLYSNMLFSRSGRVQVKGPNANFTDQVIENVLSKATPQGSLEVQGEAELLVGFSDVGISGLKVASTVEKKKALQAVDNLIAKSMIILIAILSLTVIVGLIASVRLTAELRALYEATKRIAKGDFKIRVEKKTNDEVGGLADGFNFMAGEVSRLMEETKEKARMEGELETVRIVQETLFPEPVKEIGPFRLVGHFEPASECGGDWWHYSKIGDQLFIWIGDATGHGAPAAMVTSAAKAAASLIEDIPDINPGKALAIINKAVCETTKGRIMMTFFVGALDLKTGLMTYANASHEPPYVLREVEGKFKKKHLEPLVDVNGHRLGDKIDAEYPEATVQISPGDAILCYTDGITDLTSPTGDTWGERGFVRSIVKAAQNNSPDDRMSNIADSIHDFREGTELIDDITLFVCQYQKEAAS